jgi:DNA-binding response OmpR family regulator
LNSFEQLKRFQSGFVLREKNWRAVSLSDTRASGGQRDSVVKMSPAARIVLVSDDEQMRSLLCGLFAAHGYASVTGLDSNSALAAQQREARWDLAIVDVSAAASRVLPQLKATSRALVAICVPNNGTAAQVVAGSDVALGKPFDPRELLLVVRGMLEVEVGVDTGGDAASPAAATTAGPITLTTLVNTARVGAREIELTDVETRILHELLANASNPVSRERLTRRALLRDWSPDDRALDTHINRLRRKIGPDHRGRTPLRTVRGVGYLLLAEWQLPQ